LIRIRIDFISIHTYFLVFSVDFVASELRMRFSHLFLYPLAWLYGLAIWLRNSLYDAGILKSYTFQQAIVKVGNLTVGGTGKTPHTELMAALLAEYFPSVAILSRGYKRKTSGFRLASENDSPETLGDEPYMMYQKLPGIQVAVCEDRKTGIEKLQALNPFLGAVVLDDGFQHRKVKAGFSILLSDYNQPYFEDKLLPVGRLREFGSAFRRADVIIFTRSPERVNVYDKKYVYTKVGAAAHQLVIFSHIRYLPPVFLEPFEEMIIDKTVEVLLVTGIASNQALKKKLSDKKINFTAIDYPDHHRYQAKQLKQIKEAWEKIDHPRKVVLTTEKDFVKLREFGDWFVSNSIPLAYLPIQIGFDETDQAAFVAKIEEYVKYHQRNR